MAGLAKVVQALVLRLGKGLGYNAGEVVVSHGGKDIMCAAAVLMSAPGL